MIPFTPRGKSNLSAWMVARSDGDNYGKLDVYMFPNQKLVDGPSQIVARINQDAEISRQISLWDQRGSSVIQGTLLVIPIEESLVYVRPLYLKADAGKIPELKRVIVGYEDNIAMERTLDEALKKIFPGLSGISSTLERQDIESGPDVSKQEERNLILSKNDYDKIQKLYKKVLESQYKLDQSLGHYKNKLKALGEVLQDTPVILEPLKPAGD